MLVVTVLASALLFVASVLSLLLTQALEEKKSAVAATQLELQAALRRAARQEALTEAAEGQLNKLKEESNEVCVPGLFNTGYVVHITKQCTVLKTSYPFIAVSCI